MAHVTWDFRPPGEAILKAALPTIALSLGLVVLLTVAAAVTMRRLTRKLADSEQAAVYASRHDVATGLANRGWFMNQFDALLAPTHQLGERLRAVLLIDCDYFKSINDTLGHAAGDAVLAALASRMKSLDQRIETAARLGGDEFALISAPLETADAASVLLQAVETVLMQPVLFGPRVIPVSVSIGAALFEDGSEQHIDTLLAQADMALYRAKRDGRGCSRTFDASVDHGVTPDFPVRDPAGDRADAASRAEMRRTAQPRSNAIDLIPTRWDPKRSWSASSRPRFTLRADSGPERSWPLPADAGDLRALEGQVIHETLLIEDEADDGPLDRVGVDGAADTDGHYRHRSVDADLPAVLAAEVVQTPPRS